MGMHFGILTVKVMTKLLNQLLKKQEIIIMIFWKKLMEDF
jgi:hypothetical protein